MAKNFLQSLLGENYKEGMTEDELSTALESVGVKTNSSSDAELSKMKELISKANSEAATYKKELRAKQTEQEKAEAERNEQFEAMQQKLATLEHEKKVAEYSTKFTALGYDVTSAEETANALINGDIDTVLSNTSKYLETQKDLIKSELIKKTPRPESGNTSGVTKTMTKKELFALPLQERMKFAQEHKEQYESIVKDGSVQL